MPLGELFATNGDCLQFLAIVDKSIKVHTYLRPGEKQAR